MTSQASVAKDQDVSKTCWFGGGSPSLMICTLCSLSMMLQWKGRWGMNSGNASSQHLSGVLQLDQSVLEALPPDLREQVEQVCAAQQGQPPGDRRREPVNGYSTGVLPQPAGTVLLQIPEPQESNSDGGINVIALPAFSQVN